MKGCVGNLECGEREGAFGQSRVAEKAWLCARLGSMPTRRRCVANINCSTQRGAQIDAGKYKCVSREEVCLKLTCKKGSA